MSYESFMSNLNKLVHEFWGNGKFRDKKTGAVYKNGCLTCHDTDKVQFFSEDMKGISGFPFEYLENLERIE
jgi:hypothetical protein